MGGQSGGGGPAVPYIIHVMGGKERPIMSWCKSTCLSTFNTMGKGCLVGKVKTEARTLVQRQLTSWG